MFKVYRKYRSMLKIALIIYRQIFYDKMFCAKTHFKAAQRNHDPNYTLSDYGTLERNTDAAFYFTSPFLGQVMPRLPNAINVGFIHCR